MALLAAGEALAALRHFEAVLAIDLDLSRGTRCCGSVSHVGDHLHKYRRDVVLAAAAVGVGHRRGACFLHVEAEQMAQCRIVVQVLVQPVRAQEQAVACCQGE